MLISLFCYPISGHHFLWMEPQCWVRIGLVQWAKCTRCANDGSLKSQKARSYERTSSHIWCIFFFSSNQVLKFETIFRNSFGILTTPYKHLFWTRFRLSHSQGPYFPFSRAKDPNFCKYLRQQYFKKHRRLARKLHYYEVIFCFDERPRRSLNF